MGSKFSEISVDCENPQALAAFWAEVLGRPVVEDADHADDWVVLHADEGDMVLTFLRVPESKAVKNRLHMDLRPVGCDQDEELERLLALGARHVDIGQGEQEWVVLADPEGNEFCLLKRRADEA